ncbi:MAG: DUF3696 domain-containing protein [Candidatus Magnetoovum sp. WYHC-5]|nr:DUF3696 domain-containing protein [Candidatus Magnetoovum sp. WYHC-5]
MSSKRDDISNDIEPTVNDSSEIREPFNPTKIDITPKPLIIDSLIKKIEITNFKCFEHETIELAPLNLLTGLNGMGKSTLIQAFLLLRQSHDMGFLQRELQIALNGDLIQIGNGRDVLYQYANGRTITIMFETTECRWRWIWNVDLELEKDILFFHNHEQKIKDERVQAYLSKDNNKPCELPLFGSNFHYLSAERLGPRVYHELSTYRAIKKQIGVRGEFAYSYLEEYGNTEIPIKGLCYDGTDGTTIYEQLNAWLGEIRPGTKVKTRPSIDMSLVSAVYQFIGGKDISREFRATNVGFGLSYILPLLTVILSATPGSLIILENPEAHLHPKGQAQIGRLLALAAANGVQLIVETHSDHILNGIRVATKELLITPEKVNILFFTGDIVDDKFQHYILNPKIDEDGRLDEWPDGFFDEWEKQLDKLIE